MVAAHAPKVLMVEDDPDIREALMLTLTEFGYKVHPVGTAAEALQEVVGHDFDLVLLDLGLPDLDGMMVLRMLRGISAVPVIVLTARSGEDSIVAALETGADDYVTKPFSSANLLARMNALLRRARKYHPELTDVVRLGELHIDLTQRQVSLSGERLSLTKLEYDLLAYLAQRPGRAITRRELIESVWQQPNIADDRTIDVHASWLRRKLGETAADARYLHTVRGVGLKLLAPQPAVS